MPRIKLKRNEPFEVALRRFKRACDNAGVIEDTRKKEFYEKPTWKKKRAKKEAAQKTRRMQRRNNINKKRFY